MIALRQLLALSFVLAYVLQARAEDQQSSEAWRPPPGYELLSSEASYCGPRILFFFTAYFGINTDLASIVRLCNTDSDGLTSLLDLVRCAGELELDPEAIACNAATLEELGGPAIISLLIPDQS